MAWDMIPKYELTPKDRALELIKMFNSKDFAIIFQRELIKRLKDNYIISEYQNKVLKEIEK